MREASHRSMVISEPDSLLDSSPIPSLHRDCYRWVVAISDLLGDVKHMLPIRCPCYQDLSFAFWPLSLPSRTENLYSSMHLTLESSRMLVNWHGWASWRQKLLTIGRKAKDTKFLRSKTTPEISIERSKESTSDKQLSLSIKCANGRGGRVTFSLDVRRCRCTGPGTQYLLRLVSGQSPVFFPAVPCFGFKRGYRVYYHHHHHLWAPRCRW